MQTESAQDERLEFLDAAQLAERLGVSRKWVQHYTRKGIIPAIKIGRKYLYNFAVVVQALNALQQ